MPRQRENELGRWIAAAILTAVLMAAYLVAGADANRDFARFNSNGEQHSSVEECSLK